MEKLISPTWPPKRILELEVAQLQGGHGAYTWKYKLFGVPQEPINQYGNHDGAQTQHNN